MTPAKAVERARSLWHPGVCVSAVMRYRINDVLGGHERQAATVWLPDIQQWDARGLPQETLTVVSIDQVQTLELPE